MVNGDPLETQRDVVSPSMPVELVASGFVDAIEIGHGGFGVVYRCRQQILDRTVAVKVLTTYVDDENRERFFREQRAMGRLTGHPNIVGALQVGSTESGRPFIVMQYHPQGSLDTRIRRHGPLPLDQSLRLGVRLAGALETAHRLDIFHRDVKPANILLTEYGEPALTDFGIAHIAGGFETGTGVVTGSPAFIAPEVLAGESPSAASDIYSLGSTLFCALTGHAAFERRSGEQLIAQLVRISTDPLPDLREQGIAEDVRLVIQRAMASNPADRQPTAAALGDELRRIQHHLGFPVDEMALHRIAGEVPHDPKPLLRRPRPLARRIGTEGHLPLELTSFIGRRRELVEAKNLLAASRLMTLAGIGGVGKTRLGLRVAASAEKDFLDGVWLVELEELKDESLLVDVIAAAVGVRDQSPRPTREILVDFLSSRKVLLVLDNCEQVVTAAAELAEMLLRTCPRLTILATSREVLGIGGEAILRVPPLTVPPPDHEPSLQGMPRYDAVTLFAERAAAVVPTFELTDDNRTAVARICHRLDGLPLPIELAAARLRAMSPEQILQRLTDRFTLLTRGNRAAPSRQQTLQLCIDWSHDLCTPPEQLMWAQLAVFAGSFELDAAEQVCGERPEPETFLDTLASLVDKSILIREESHGVVRLRLLETLREFGREQAHRSGQYPDLQRRHRDWYLQLALDAEADWISPRQLGWIDRLAREQSNLREAMEYCLSDSPDVGLRLAASLYFFWSSQGHYGEGRQWLYRLLASQGSQPSGIRAKALYAASSLAQVQGDLEAGAALVSEARAHATGTTELTRAFIAQADGLLALHSGDPARASRLLEESSAAFRHHHITAFQIEALSLMGLPYSQLGNTKRALECFEQVLAITESCNESINRAYVLWAMAVLVWSQGDLRHATKLLDQGLRLARLAGDPLAMAACFEALAWSAESEGDAHRAVVLMSVAAKLGNKLTQWPTFQPHLPVHHDECETDARHILGDNAFDAADREGHELTLDAAVAFALRERIAGIPSTPDMAPQLTKREQEIAELIAEGLTNRGIATRLTISQRTAQGHVEHILAKLGFTSRAQVAAWVVESKGEQ